jgi:hypothetical protein
MGQSPMTFLFLFSFLLLFLYFSPHPYIYFCTLDWSAALTSPFDLGPVLLYFFFFFTSAFFFFPSSAADFISFLLCFQFFSFFLPLDPCSTSSFFCSLLSPASISSFLSQHREAERAQAGLGFMAAAAAHGQQLGWAVVLCGLGAATRCSDSRGSRGAANLEAGCCGMMRPW